MQMENAEQIRHDRWCGAGEWTLGLCATQNWGDVALRIDLTKAHRREQPYPTFCHLGIAPRRSQCRIHVHHHVRVIAHHRISQHRGREHVRQREQPILDPLLATIEVAAARRILATEERSTDAPGHAVIGPRHCGIDQLLSCVAHDAKDRALRRAGEIRRRRGEK